MSCGTPHDGCEKVLTKVYAYLDGEMSDDDCSEIRAHIDDCTDCLRAYGIEREFKALLARKCGCDAAPEELRAKVLTRLHEVRVEILQVEFRAE